MSFSSLLKSINSTCCLSLQRSINAFIQSRLPCRDAFIMFLSEYANECIVQVISDIILEKEVRINVERRFDMRSAEGAEKEKEAINFWLKPKLISLLCPYLQNLLNVPVKHPEDESVIIFYVCLVDPGYTFESDELNFSGTILRCFDVCSAVLLNAFLVREEKQMNVLHEKLFGVARACLLKTGECNEILSEILTEARILTKAERCSLYILSRDKKFAKVYSEEKTSPFNTREIAIDHSIVAYVAAHGETLLVEKAQSHPLIQKNSEILPGLKTRNLLCFPVRDRIYRVIGVFILFNKEENAEFTYWDEKIVEVSGFYLSLALANGILQRKIQLNKAQELLSVELISHHLTKKDIDFNRVVHCKKKHNFDEMLDFHWIARKINYSDTICYTLRMFDDLGLSKLWKIPRETLLSFIFGVRRGYRDLPYHNWEHGFSVAQFAYFLMHELNLMQNVLITYARGLEAVAFLVSALCHDLDHRGTTNGFQVLSRSTLASLYGTDGSVMERHHFSHTLTLLNTENCNIFENLTIEQYSRVIALIKDMILATDLAEYVKALPEERNMSIIGYKPEKKAHRSLLLSLMMTCCDLNDQVKGWLHCRNIAEKIYSEFFRQGDMEKEMGSDPSPSMDRKKAFIPELQLEFLTVICLPCFTVLSNIFPSMKPCVSAIEDTFKCWGAVIEWVRINKIPENLFLKYLYDPALEAYVLKL